MSGWDGITCGGTAFITYSAWPSISDMKPVTRSITSRVSGEASAASRPLPSPPPRAALASSDTTPLSRSKITSGSRSRASVSAWISSSMCWRIQGTAVNCTRWVTSCTHTHSRKSLGSSFNARSTATRFGATSSSCPSGREKNSYWPSTLPDRKASTAPAWAPVTRPPTAVVSRPGCLVATSLAVNGSITVDMLATLASIQPGRSVTTVAAVTAGSVSRVSSVTRAAARSVAWRSSATTAWA